jgi:exosortase A
MLLNPPPAVVTAARPTVGAATWSLIGLALLLPFFLFFDTAHGIVDIWNRSGTFAHGYVVLPISLWMIWQRRATLARLPVRPYWPALAALAACGAIWLLAELGGVLTAAQYAFAAMLPLTALAILGKRIARAIAFPLLFVLFAVPFGEVFIPPLIDITANFTVAAIRATGIPVLREGNSFALPSGNWSVVEACSGLRYLISSITLGCLYASLTYRSRWRQAAFVLCSILVPIIANGMRAFMIVMIGHLSGMKLAVGVDHIIYGWVFFGIVMFLLFWIGSLWREDRVAEVANNAVLAAPPPAPAPATRLAAAGLAIALCTGGWPLWLRHIEGAEHNPPRADLSRFVPAWQEAPAFTSWTPAFLPANAQLHRFLRHDGRTAGLDVLYYRQQDAGSKLVSSSNVLAPLHDPWRVADSATRTETVGERRLAVRESALAGPGPRMIVWQWYWIEGRTTASDYAGKLLQVKERFLGQGDDGAAVLVSAPYDGDPEQARATLRAFLAANLHPLEAALNAARRR